MVDEYFQVQKVRVLEERKSSRRATLSRRAIVQKEMPVIAGMHMSVSFHQPGGCKLGNTCAFQHTEQAAGEPKKRNTSAVVAPTLDLTQAGKEVTSPKSRAKGDLLPGVSGIP